MFCHEPKKPLAIYTNQGGRVCDQASVGHCCKCIDGTLQFGRGIIRNPDRLQVQSDRCRLDLGNVSALAPRADDDPDLGDARDGLPEKAHPLAADRLVKIGDTRCIPLGTRQAFHQAALDRVGHSCEYNRNGSGALLHSPCRQLADGNDHLGRRTDQFVRVGIDRFCITGIAHIKLKVAVLDPPEASEAVPQYTDWEG